MGDITGQAKPAGILALFMASLLAVSAPATAAQDILTGGITQNKPEQRVKIELLAERPEVRPGETVTIALRQTIIPGWHTYWSNPGDSGEPTHIEWRLPEGAAAGPIQWPLPEAIPVGPLMNYGYSRQAILLTDIEVPADAAGPSFDIDANVRWLVCADICVPEEASASLSLPLSDGGTGASVRPSPLNGVVAEARAALPKPTPWPAQYGMIGDDDVVIRISGVADELPRDASFYFFPLHWGAIGHAAPQQASFDGGDLVLTSVRGDAATGLEAGLDGVLAVETRGPGGGLERQGYKLSASPAALDPAPSSLSPEVTGGVTLLMALAFAFLGGIILNLMPCVFPVLSLKALSLAKCAGDDRERRVSGLVYFGGVMASFAVIAAALAALRMGGTAIGWGMQFQSPGFVLAMMALFLALGLNLSGVFSIGTGVTGLGDSLCRRPGRSGDFFTGVLATVVATPCTAPFMGAAMGYAFTQPVPVVFAILLALGAGFAAPILLLSFSPAFARILPKPGAWMETFKQLMAFPLYATVAWLLWVLSVQRGSDGVLMGAAVLVVTGFAAWLLGRNAETQVRSGSAAAVIVALAIGGGAWSLGGVAATQPQGERAVLAEGAIASEPFSQARLDELTRQGRPVFVNLTAAWCITCKVNERVALNSDEFASALKDKGIAYLVGDWTNGDPEITALLSRHGRAGVPLYLLYSGAPGEPPQILPQILTGPMVLGRFAQLPSLSPQTAGRDL